MQAVVITVFFFFSSRRRHTRWNCDWSSDCALPISRYLWSHDKEYLNDIPGLIRPCAFLVQSALRRWDFVAAQRPDSIITISDLIRKRCEKYYRRQSEVVYPSVVLKEEGRRKKEEGEYYLVVSRLVPYKRIGLAIEAGNWLKENLGG